MAGMTALVLAGTRPGGDPLATLSGVSHKALIDICGMPMLERVVRAVAGFAGIGRIVVAIERPELVAALPPFGVPVVAMPAASGPSASVEAALQSDGAPLLVTTGDHALLESTWIDEFISAAPADADAVVALALRHTIEAAAPQTQRTYLRFADGEYSGCNLFLLRTPAARGVVRLWQDIEAERKRPLAMLRRLGFGYALRYRLGTLTLGDALGRLSQLSETRIRAVILRDGRAAIDVDKPADLDLVRELLRLARPSPP
jgi:GTP:adenosylcobinamide-phosphate guanylyltransferase